MKNPTRKQLAKALKDKRKKLGIGVREASKLVGVSPSTYSRIENGKQMTIETYFKAIEWAEELLELEKGV